MVNFSTISQDPTVRALVQDGLLERAFHDALFPRLLFRAEAAPQLWPNNVGDSMVFTGVGLMTPNLQPLVPGNDPSPTGYQAEQWRAQLNQYANTTDTAMPTSIAAIANLFLRNAQQLGLNSGQSINRLVRERAYNAAMSGQTVATSTGGSSTSLHVDNLNGFTTARRPDVSTGSPVAFTAVTASNPLAITINGVANTVVGFTSDYAGDEVGPGTLTLGSAVAATARWAVLASDQTYSVYVGGGTRTDDIASNDTLTLAAIRSAVSRFWAMNVPEMPDGRFHAHVDPVAMAQVFSDQEFQRLLTALPDYYMYKQFSIGELLSTVFFRNSENPLPETVFRNADGSYNQADPFGGDLYSNATPATGVRIHRTLFFGMNAIFEYYQDLSALVTDAGVTGKIGKSTIDNNGIEVNTDRIQLILRSPLNRTQDLVSTTWRFIGDWPVRTDATTGDAARYKRLCQILSGE
jgi:hypothetical protein